MNILARCTHRLTLSTVLLLTACGGGSVSPVGPAAVAPTTPVAPTPPVAPTVSLAANPTSISAGGSSTLTWTSTNATSCTASGAWSGAQATAGSSSVSPSTTSAYSLDCSGTGGAAPTQTATVTVAAATTPVVVTVSISASPNSVAVGGSSTLTWTSTNAMSCTATGAWTGTKATAGTYSTPALTAAATYTLSCSGAGGSASGSTTVTIASASSAPTAASASTVGPYTVNTYTAGIPGGAHYTVPKIYYPSGGPAPYPGAVFITGLHSSYTEPPYTVVINGQTVVEADVVEWGTLLASHGFIVMFIDATNYDAAPPERATALLEAVDSLAAENARTGSPILGKLQATNIAVTGHSFGGAGALYAAEGNGGAINSKIKAVMALSPVPQGPYFTTDAVPSIVICGQDDPYMNDYQGLYDSIPSTTPSALAEFKTTAEFDSMHAIALTPLGTHGTDPLVARLGLSFLEVYLTGDTRYRQFLVNDASRLLVFSYNP